MLTNMLTKKASSAPETSGGVIALAGNPNVGKSTVFNRLTGLHQHTGNWPGKTVATAEGFFDYGGVKYRLIDIPGMYSYAPHSAEEEAAVEFLMSGSADAVIVVCDAGCLARGIGFALETAELTNHIIICVNLTDEAERRGIHVDSRKLSHMLGMPVITTSAASGKGVNELAAAAAGLCASAGSPKAKRPFQLTYPQPIEHCLDDIEKTIAAEWHKHNISCGVTPRYAAIKLLEGDCRSLDRISSIIGYELMNSDSIRQAANRSLAGLQQKGLDPDRTAASIASARIRMSDTICGGCVAKDDNNARCSLDRRLDRIFTGRLSGRLCMIMLLALVFWLTITGANYPSEWLSALFGHLEGFLRGCLEAIHLPQIVQELLMDGVYRVLTWIISVMLPPMAIFFPLFTLLEDSGYLPRVAFNLDGCLHRCGACGKQALTSCMGFGCNAVGVTGCRIIDSPRERLMAVVTNSFIPCNGRFPMLTALISMFFLGRVAAPFDSVLGAALLTALICLGLAASFAVSKLLSLTLLKGVPSSFTLELPPYRRPRILSVIVRSVFDRTLFVLGRAAAVAAPAGAVIWLMANIPMGGGTILSAVCHALDPVGRFLGMDGVILMAFILGMPANEIVIPLMIMAYMSQGSLTGLNDLSQIHGLFVSNGWTASTAICTVLFSLMHWPCTTTCLTIYRETKSLKWTILSILIPTSTGVIICAAAAALMNAF